MEAHRAGDENYIGKGANLSEAAALAKKSWYNT